MGNSVQKSLKKPKVKLNRGRGDASDPEEIYGAVWQEAAGGEGETNWDKAKDMYEELEDEEKEALRVPLNEIIEEFGDVFWEEGEDAANVKWSNAIDEDKQKIALLLSKCIKFDG